MESGKQQIKIVLHKSPYDFLRRCVKGTIGYEIEAMKEVDAQLAWPGGK